MAGPTREDFLLASSTAEASLTRANAVALGRADPPAAPGVYALFHDGVLRYIGEATGAKGLRNRRRNYVSGDDGHTTHRVFQPLIPDKALRRRHIEAHVEMAWCVIEDPLLAKAIERFLIWRLRPEWNRA